jgi:hypothetical protein
MTEELMWKIAGADRSWSRTLEAYKALGFREWCYPDQRCGKGAKDT